MVVTGNVFHHCRVLLGSRPHRAFLCVPRARFFSTPAARMETKSIVLRRHNDIVKSSQDQREVSSVLNNLPVRFRCREGFKSSVQPLRI